MSDTSEFASGAAAAAAASGPEIDEYVNNNTAYAAAFGGPLALPPARKLAVVACMDARLNIFAMLGLKEGDAHIIRNAGGAVTEDAIRSVVISQRLLGTRRIMLIHHTDCGMQTFKDDEFKAELHTDTGIRPPWSPEAFTDLEDDVRQSIRRIEADPFVPYKHSIRGFVFDVETGKLNEVGYVR
ncbi:MULTISPECIES: beta-class carbonic anhydrase [Streptomyces]|uniref:carbonic anhydrase n=1 Tax=Streptomyces tsukubensis (strain DSM 42081 / NBRC 108919 / NRRL 18488 / 9993) TaxID=1114943 RepID=I2MX96_STRT9|nr:MULTISPECIES: carbonic anhydrase [Streptomyces]AZK93780.1 carbonate dehydratase [Streptomyces tsukubensis]EIF89393.1 carbonic anhydrase [Streptomyces tsukubensis NRRL18488]MYS67321.1 carbonic anhydrase [Streptomyces sp. SID5473]QKM70083.1 carbonic anhydrase [Streptomyces tsukubensis NRRL18488]TAI45941.1 carbonic anhydrase [Streptomyces tsukubensis]